MRRRGCELRIQVLHVRNVRQKFDLFLDQIPKNLIRAQKIWLLYNHIFQSWKFDFFWNIKFFPSSLLVGSHKSLRDVVLNAQQNLIWSDFYQKNDLNKCNHWSLNQTLQIKEKYFSCHKIWFFYKKSNVIFDTYHKNYHFLYHGIRLCFTVSDNNIRISFGKQ